MTNDKYDDTGKKRDEKESAISEMIKKVVSIGVGAAFMTEDAVKNILQDIPLPKDIITGLVQNARSAKEEFTESLRQEIKHYLSKVDSSKVIDDLVNRYDINIEAKMSFTRKNQPATTDDSDSKSKRENS